MTSTSRASFRGFSTRKHFDLTDRPSGAQRSQGTVAASRDSLAHL